MNIDYYYYHSMKRQAAPRAARTRRIVSYLFDLSLLLSFRKCFVRQNRQVDEDIRFRNEGTSSRGHAISQGPHFRARSSSRGGAFKNGERVPSRASSLRVPR